MWIKLHFFQTGDEVMVQTQNICAVYPGKSYKGAISTVIQFCGEEENYIQVIESIDEIGAMIVE